MLCPNCHQTVHIRPGTQFCVHCRHPLHRSDRAPQANSAPASLPITRVNVAAGSQQDPHDTAFDPLADAPYTAAPASIIDHDDYLLEVEPSMHPSSPSSPPQPTQDATSAALLSLLQRARAQTGEQHKAAAKPSSRPEPSPADDAERSDIADIAFVAGIAGSASALDDLEADARTPRAADTSRRRGAPRKKPSRGQRRDAAPRTIDDTASDDDLIIDEDGFEIGDFEDISAFGGAHEPDAFGEEDSGPVPTSAEGSSRRSGRAASQRSRRGPSRRQAASTLSGLADRAKRVVGRIPPRAQLVAIAALMLLGLSYVFFGGDDPAASPEATARAAAAAAPAAANQLNPGQNNAANPNDPNMELIPLDGAGGEVASPNHPLFPLSILAADAKPMNTKQVKMGRTCVLRDGPSSRFKALIKQTPATAKVIVLGESESDWKLISQNGLTGWSKTTCSGSAACDLRQGPGDPFKAVVTAADSLKVNGPLLSGDRWRYVKYEDLYGWMGPACWK